MKASLRNRPMRQAQVWRKGDEERREAWAQRCFISPLVSICRRTSDEIRAAWRLVALALHEKWSGQVQRCALPASRRWSLKYARDGRAPKNPRRGLSSNLILAVIAPRSFNATLALSPFWAHPCDYRS